MGIFDFLFEKSKKYSIGITPDRETQKRLNQQNKDILALFMKFLLDSGRYEEESIYKLVNKNKGAIAKVITSGKSLELEEKKRLGVNGRKKYGQDYIATLTTRGLDYDASTVFFLSSYNQASGIIGRQYKLAEYKKAGVKRIRISATPEEHACQVIRKYGGRILDIDDVPQLPLPGCDKSYCHCWFIPVID
jgi:hypothetical protein